MNLSLLSPNVTIKIVYRLPFPTYLFLPIRCVDWLYLFWKDFGSSPVRTVDCVFLCVSSVHAARVQPWLSHESQTVEDTRQGVWIMSKLQLELQSKRCKSI